MFSARLDLMVQQFQATSIHFLGSHFERVGLQRLEQAVSNVTRMAVAYNEHLGFSGKLECRSTQI